MRWTETACPRYDRSSRSYASDSDDEWILVAPYMSKSCKRVRPRNTATQYVSDAIQSIETTGSQWTLLPKGNCPPFTAVLYFSFKLQNAGTLGVRNVIGATSRDCRYG